MFNHTLSSIYRRAGLFVAGALLCLSAPSYAANLSYVFNSPTGVLGTSQAYTNNGVTVTAYGFNSSNIATKLFGKNDGGDEIGIGLASPAGTSDNEIQTNNFVQLNLAQFWATHPTNVTMSFGSVQSGESWKLFGSNTLGSLGTFLLGGTADHPATVGIPGSFGSYKYLGVQAGKNDILISTLSSKGRINVPEPSMLLVLGSSLLIARLRKRQQPQTC